MSKCKKCDKELLEDDRGFLFADEEICKECWCELVGDEIESHPIGGSK